MSNNDVQIKIEANEILRGSVFPCEEMELATSAQELFELSTIVTCLSEPDLYGGKICAALDRQHPRDFFDVKFLLENNGITEEIKIAFIVYLVSHNRPMAELLDPQLHKIENLYHEQFEGMTVKKVPLKDLYVVRDKLISNLKNSLTEKDKKFILSVKTGEPEWNLLKAKNVKDLPAINWKLANIKKMPAKKRNEAFEKLKNILDAI